MHLPFSGHDNTSDLVPPRPVFSKRVSTQSPTRDEDGDIQLAEYPINKKAVAEITAATDEDLHRLQ